jgi:hypothetical protein
MTVDLEPDLAVADPPGAATLTDAPAHPDPPPARNRGGRPKGSTDSKPRKRPSRARANTTAPGEPTISQVDRKLTASLEYMLLQPASISREVGFPFGVVHFSNSAKPTAAMIVKASHDFDELRTILTSADKMVSGKVLFAAAIAGYLAPALLALRGVEGPAYMIGRATPDEVAACAELMTNQELAQQVANMKRQGLSDDQMAAILNANATGPEVETVSSWGGAPGPPGAPPAA